MRKAETKRKRAELGIQGRGKVEKVSKSRRDRGYQKQDNGRKKTRKMWRIRETETVRTG